MARGGADREDQDRADRGAAVVSWTSRRL